MFPFWQLADNSSLQLSGCRKTSKTLCCEYRAIDCFAHDIGGDGSDYVQIGGFFSDRHRVDRIPVRGRMHGADGSGVSVMCHACDLGQLALIEGSIRENGSNGGICIPAEQAAGIGNIAEDLLFRGAEALSGVRSPAIICPLSIS